MTMGTQGDGKVAVKLGYGDYLRFSRLMHESYGLYFSEKRRTDLERGLLQGFSASPCADWDAYYDLLLDPVQGVVHKQRLVNVLTIGESHFFRNAGQFDALYMHVLPSIIERRKSLRTLRIWSAGCAGGQEPYSIAMMLRELLPDVDEWAITILGTDVNTSALDQAQQGVYSDWAFREERAVQMRARYFQPAGKRYELCPEVRRMVSFAQLNLVEDDYPSFRTNTMFMDLILCRNVTIYFTPTVTQSVVARYYEALVDGGWLAVGHSEHSLSTYQQFQVRNYPSAIFYQRTSQPAEKPVDPEWLKPPIDTASPPIFRTLLGGDTKTLLPPSPELSVAPEEPPEEVGSLDMAKNLLICGHSEQARDLLMASLEGRPEHAESCALLGQAYANLGSWPEAETWCRCAIQLNPLMPDPYYTLALVLEHQGHFEQALLAMKTVIYLNSSSVRGHYSLANLYYSLGQSPQAIKSLDNAQRLIEERDEHEVLPGMGGFTVGHLRQAILQQKQLWSATEVIPRR